MDAVSSFLSFATRECMTQRTLIITAFNGFVSKNILSTDVLTVLLKDLTLDIVLVVPAAKQEYFQSIYGSPRCRAVGVELTPNSMAHWMNVWSRMLIDTHYLWYKRRERYEQHKSVSSFIRYLLEQMIVKLTANKVFIHSWFRQCVLRRVSAPTISDLLNILKPVAVFSTDIFDLTDILFNVEARRCHIPILGMVRSWDNCFSKGLLQVVPDWTIVNNDTIRDELRELHSVLPERIFVGGMPQFDVYVKGASTSRVDFFRALPADMEKRLVVLAPAGAVLSHTDGQIVDQLIQAVDQQEFVQPIHFHIRNHPQHSAKITVDRPNFTSEIPGKQFHEISEKATELLRSDIGHLADTLFYADVVVYVATTIGIDALMFDKPQIIIDFDGHETLPYIQSVKRYHDEDHMKKMITCGGVTVAHSPRELIDAINVYLKNPHLHHEGRERMREQQVKFMDGKSGERIGSFLLAHIPTEPCLPAST